MKTKSRILLGTTVGLLVGLGGVLCTVIWPLRPVRDPEYLGKPLAHWLDQVDQNWVPTGMADSVQRREDAIAALQEIGTNAIPALLARVRTRDSRTQKQVRAMLWKLQLIKFDRLASESRRDQGRVGFLVLGASAKSAIPDLIALLRDKDPGVNGIAAECLGEIGPEAEPAIPAILLLLTNCPNGMPEVSPMHALGRIHQRPDLVIPAIVTFMQKHRNDPNYFALAIMALDQYGTQAASAIPVIEAAIPQLNSWQTQNAQNALRRITPIPTNSIPGNYELLRSILKQAGNDAAAPGP